jgi:glycosyltransferase involved in cell wall biosynthesis
MGFVEMTLLTNTQPPSVLMFVPQYPYPVVGGLERQSHELSKALTQLNLKITVISGKIDEHGLDCEHVEGIKVIRLPWSKNKFLRSILSTLHLAWHMVHIRADYEIVHIHNISWAGGIVLTIAKLLNKKTLVKLPNVGKYGIPGIQARTLGPLLLSILKRSDTLIALSNDSALEIASVGYPNRKILKITNGVSLNDFSYDGNKQRNPTPIRVLFSGRLATQKGISDLLAAWVKISAQLHQQLQVPPQSLLLDICGDGPLKQEITDIIKQENIQDTVILHGHVSNVKSMLENADIFVLPSYFEGNSNAILEAMSSGLPIVSTCVGGTLTMVGAAGAELISQPGDRDALANNLFSLISNPEKRRAYGVAMRERAASHFDIGTVSKRYRDVYTLLQQSDKNQSVCDLSSPIFEETIQ